MVAKKVEELENIKRIEVSAPNLQTMTIKVIGSSPLVINKFSQKAKEEMMATQEAGRRAKSTKNRPPKDFEECYQQACHKSSEGWQGIPAMAFKNAMISACRLVGAVMVTAKLAIFILPDGFDEDDGTPLVKITKGEPHMSILPVRVGMGTTDLRARPMWNPGWEAELAIQFDADLMYLKDVMNLLVRAGKQVGICEGRPSSKKSCGMGWGLFEITNGKEAK